MEKKTCFKCNKEKPLSEFYKHSQMADGYLNKCKDCTKTDVSAAYNVNIKNSDYVESERKRGRQKYRKLYKGTGKANSLRSKQWTERYPEKRKAQQASQHIKQDGKETHHWSYLEAHFKDVIFLSKSEHMKAHRFIVYDQERRMYRRFDTNELLDTKEKHQIFIFWCIVNKED
jgi:hypothetical protein